MFRLRSTSPPKSAWPGVSTILSRIPSNRRSLLRQDSDALLALQVAGIHDPLDDDLVGPERTRLTQHRVDQGGLAVVDMGDDGDVPDVGARRGLMHEPWIRC